VITVEGEEVGVVWVPGRSGDNEGVRKSIGLAKVGLGSLTPDGAVLP
jgi:hypothetical protein